MTRIMQSARRAGRAPLIALVVAALLMALLLPAAQGETPRKLTLMVYLCGSNLESAYGSASSDIQEMLDAGGAGRDVTVLLMTGGTERWTKG